MKRIDKKKFLVTVRIRCNDKHKKLPNFGLGAGILSRQEVTVGDPKGRGFDSALFAAYKLRLEPDFVSGVVEVIWKELECENKTQRVGKTVRTVRKK